MNQHAPLTGKKDKFSNEWVAISVDHTDYYESFTWKDGILRRLIFYTMMTWTQHGKDTWLSLSKLQSSIGYSDSRPAPNSFAAYLDKGVQKGLYLKKGKRKDAQFKIAITPNEVSAFVAQKRLTYLPPMSSNGLEAARTRARSRQAPRRGDS